LRDIEQERRAKAPFTWPLEMITHHREEELASQPLRRRHPAVADSRGRPVAKEQTTSKVADKPWRPGPCKRQTHICKPCPCAFHGRMQRGPARQPFPASNGKWKPSAALGARVVSAAGRDGEGGEREERRALSFVRRGLLVILSPPRDKIPCERTCWLPLREESMSHS
jgi:hypothetical protein